MLTLAEIKKAFPEMVHNRKRGMLREYLQYHILLAIYESKYASKLVFLGGTCLRLCYNTPRFSEDLDFDNRGMTPESFDDLGHIIEVALRKIGLDAHMNTVFKGAYHCHIRIPKLLFEYGLSGYEEEKILIQIDTVPQPIVYEYRHFSFAGFGIKAEGIITPPDVLLSQKICAAYQRKRKKGRDFFDIMFLISSGVRPHYEYLLKTLHVSTPEMLHDFVVQENASIDFSSLVHDLEPFLFEIRDGDLVRNFPKFMENFNWK